MIQQEYSLSILEQSKAVRTFPLVQCEYKVDLNSVKPYETNIVEWLSPMIDLSGYNVYPMNGITEGLNWWMAKESRGIYMAEGDYQWVKPTGNDIFYMSVPSAIDGNFKSIPNNVPVALDLAYVGSTKPYKIHIEDNVEYVFFSLSKPFGLRNIRTGWYFTKEKDPRLEAIIHNAKYYNYYAHGYAEEIISKYSIEYVHNTLHKYQYSICKEYGFTPSDSVWLATTNDPTYNKFKRGNINRVSLAKEIELTYSCST